MRHMLNCSIAILIFIACIASAHAQPSLVLSPTTKLTPFKIVNGQPVKQRPVNRSSVIKSSNFTAVVVASWCGYSRDLLRDIAAREKPQPDLIIFADDEATVVARRAERNGTDEEEVRQWLAARRQANQLLYDPKGIGFNLQYYMMPLKDLAAIRSFPTYLTCSGEVCKEMSIRERLSWDP